MNVNVLIPADATATAKPAWIIIIKTGLERTAAKKGNLKAQSKIPAFICFGKSLLPDAYAD